MLNKQVEVIFLIEMKQEQKGNKENTGSLVCKVFVYTIFIEQIREHVYQKCI